MAEDWRISIALEDEDQATALAGALRGREARDELVRELGGRVAVSSGDNTVFLYTDTHDTAEAARRELLEVLREEGLPGEPRLDRWHPVAERWEDASVPLPSTESELEAERAWREQDETAESQATGVAQWEVRIELPSHRAAAEFAEQLEARGHPVIRRWTYLLVGASNSDEADELAEQLKNEAPAGSLVHVEPGTGLAWELAARNPFAVFGGLAG